MLATQSQTKKRPANYQAQLAWWNETITAIEEHEKAEWRKVTPGTCRLMVYWLQMVGCGVECMCRVGFHGCAWAAALLWFLGELLVFSCAVRVTNAVRKSQAVTLADYGYKDSESLERVSGRQLRHHQFRLMMYGQYLPQFVWYNLRAPWQPLFLDGADVTLFRPAKPRKQPQNLQDCFDGICQWCCEGCCDCCPTVVQIGERYIRTSLCCLSGYHSCHCGACCGPCASELCYVPCSDIDGYPSKCRFCEPEETRLERWMREGHEAKLARTRAFFDAYPDLMRPNALIDAERAQKALQDAAEVSTKPALPAPKQQALPPMEAISSGPNQDSSSSSTPLLAKGRS
mmetsp:Transcript_49052/g.116709  ORF Transcript_49052/g.116709 Transcript_49052/m.116709 type:complete len:344 (+) Transcript_49052:128-1159(+)